jgi:hypothetical protein
MYYILDDYNQTIVETAMEEPQQDDLDELTSIFKCDLIVIEGEQIAKAFYTPKNPPAKSPEQEHRETGKAGTLEESGNRI